MKYGLKLENPKEFYHELHRPVHFINFTSQVIVLTPFSHAVPYAHPAFAGRGRGAAGVH